MRFDPSRTSGIADTTPPARRPGARDKTREIGDLLRSYYLRRRAGASSFESLFADFAEYDELLGLYAGRTLRESKLFEIGFGARPYRLLALAAMGVDVTGVDPDAPVVRATPAEFWAIYRANGAERAARSVVRTIFDRAHRRAFNDALAERGLRPPRVDDRLRVADAATLTLDSEQFDLIYAENVFEHIPREGLERLVAAMCRWLRPGGIAAIRPNVFTGIMGGHLLEWNLESFEAEAPTRRSEPWDHLRERRFVPNTYINELTRADYRALFSAHFEILEERVKLPDLGREYLTPQLRRELSDYTEDELFSNQVLFVLRPR